MTDIQRYGETEGVGWYWVKEAGMFGGVLRCVGITALGEVFQVGLTKDWDGAGWDKADALAHHLRSGIAEADADLERRRQELPDEPEPVDYATQKFLDSGWD